MEPIKIGIVGIGRAGWGAHTVEVADKEDMFKIVAACDIIEERIDMMKEKYGCKIYTKVQDLVNDPEVELVDIATRSCDHYKHAKMALDAGKAVLVEKPLSVEYEQAKDLMDNSNKPGKPRLFVRHNRRFEVAFNEVLKTINSGILGDVYEAGTTCLGFEFRDDWQTLNEFGGGLFRNWGPHLIDHCLNLLGAKVADTYSEFKHITAGGDCEDHVYIRLLGENDRTVTLTLSGAVALPRAREFYAYGNRGAIETIGNKVKLRYINPEQVIPEPIANPGAPAMSFGKSGTFATKTPIEWIEKEYELEGENLSQMWTHLYKDFREGTPYPITDDEALEVIRVIAMLKNNTKIVKINKSK